MANDCLVTKLKGVVNNDNLPVLGKIRVNLPWSGSPDVNQQIWLGTYDKKCQIDCVGCEFDLNGGGEPYVTSYLLDEHTNYIRNMHINQQGAYYTLDVYNVAVFVFPSTYPSVIGLSSLKYAPLKAVRINKVSNDVDDLLLNCNGLISMNYANHDINFIKAVKAANPGLETIKTGSTDYADGIELTQEISTWNVKYISRVYGNIELLPVSNINIIEGCSPNTGNLANYIARLRAAGRTSGIIRCNWLGGNFDVDHTIRQHLEAAGEWAAYVANGGNAYLSWDANTYEYSITDPGWVKNYDDEFTAY